MTEVGQLSERRRSGKVIEMSLALKDRPCAMADGLANLATLLLPHEPERAPDGTTVQVCGDAAEQLRFLEGATGQPAESVLAMSLGLLETLVLANREGRQMMLVSRFGFPLRKVVLPR